MAQTAPILDVGPLVDRPKVRIDGKLYAMRAPDEFAYTVHREQQRDLQRLGFLLKKKRQTKAEKKDQERLLEHFMRQMLVDVPDAVFARLGLVQRLNIIDFFSQRLRAVRTMRVTAAPSNGHLTRSTTGKN